MIVRLAPELRGIVAPAILWLRGATVVEREPRLDDPLAAVEAAMRAAVPADVTPVRTMYKRVGLDPTRNRPSSEALLRRVRKGDGLPRINNMVDVCNWCSMEFQLPYGLYDVAHVEGDSVDLRIGRPGEAYDGIRKDTVHVDGRITLADSRSVRQPDVGFRPYHGDDGDARRAAAGLCPARHARGAAGRRGRGNSRADGTVHRRCDSPRIVAPLEEC
ncbi:MAG: phenylalanine--tRNA ligase beta subunit-related protein [Vicinamibacterales bacterium]